MPSPTLPAEVTLQAGTLKFLDDSPKKLFIGGEWVAAASGETFQTLNPANGETLAEVAAAGQADVDRAVVSARAAFESGEWPAMTGVQRGDLLYKLADLMEGYAQELAELETLDNGKPIRTARGVDVSQAIKYFRYFAGWASKIEGRTIPVAFPDQLVYTVREPVGVCAQIIPWNFPLLMAAWKLAPALATGNTVILKPAEQTPLSVLRLAGIIVEAGFPAGVVNVITGFGVPAGAAMAAHPGIDKVAFTGSTEVGRKIMEAAARSNLKNVTLELGGKSPNVVFADADMGKAIRGAQWAIFSNSGQECVAGSRLFVERSAYDQVVEGLAQATGKIRVGNGFENNHIGPLISAEQLTRVMGYIDGGRASGGAEIVTGGARIGEEGYFLQPTIFTHHDDSLALVQEEIFGPVAAVTAFDDWDELVARANATSYGLSAGVFTQDITKAHRFAAAVKAGTVWINQYGLIDQAAPFGGYKQSGIGREHGQEALDAYTETKTVWVNLG